MEREREKNEQPNRKLYYHQLHHLTSERFTANMEWCKLKSFGKKQKLQISIKIMSDAGSQAKSGYHSEKFFRILSNVIEIWSCIGNSNGVIWFSRKAFGLIGNKLRSDEIEYPLEVHCTPLSKFDRLNFNSFHKINTIHSHCKWQNARPLF